MYQVLYTATGLGKGSRIVLTRFELVQALKNIVIKGYQFVSLLLECGRRQRKVSNELDVTTLTNWRVCCTVSAIREKCSRPMMRVERMYETLPFQLHSYSRQYDSQGGQPLAIKVCTSIRNPDSKVETDDMDSIFRTVCV
jgi:hypothetical protein